MNADEIAERFSIRPGYRLADYIEVGIPVYSIVLQVSTLVHKKIGPIEEFLHEMLAIGNVRLWRDRGLLGP